MRGLRRAMGATAMGALLAGAAGSLALSGCGRNDAGRERRDVAESGAAADVIGRPEGADSIPPEMRGTSERETEGRPTDDSQGSDSLRRPERRPIRNIPPPMEPDSGRP